MNLIKIFLIYKIIVSLYQNKKTMDDKRYNVWMIRNKDGNFYREKYRREGRAKNGKPIMVFDGINWEDDFHSASFFNYKGAEIIVDKLKMKGLSIVGYEEYKKSL